MTAPAPRHCGLCEAAARLNREGLCWRCARHEREDERISLETWRNR